MAISLNDHESRIKALEGNSGNYSETTLYSGSSTTTVTLSQSINNFDAIVIMTDVSEYSGDCRFIPKSLYNRQHRLEYASGIGVSTITPTDNRVVFNDNWQGRNTTHILAVVGLKLYYNFSYNIYRLANSMSFHFFKCLIKIRN